MGSEPLNADRERRSSIWAAELVDVLRLQRAAVIGVAVVVCASGLAVAAVAPTVLAPRPLVGAAVGSAACLLAVAGAVALDAADPVVRGRRHIRGAVPVHAATVGGAGTAPLVARVEHRLDREGSVRLATVGVGVDRPRVLRLTGQVARSLARSGWRVLLVDLRGADGRDGIAEVLAGSRRLSEVVDHHPTLDLAEVGPGRDRDAALARFDALIPRLPGDVDVLLVTLPDHGADGVLAVVGAMDGLLVVAQSGTTSRSEVVGALDALADAGAPVEVVLLEQEGDPERTPAEVRAVPEPRGEEPAGVPRPGGTEPRVAQPAEDAWEGALPDLPRPRPESASGDAWDRVHEADVAQPVPAPERGSCVPDSRDATAEPPEAGPSGAPDRLAEEIWGREGPSRQ